RGAALAAAGTHLGELGAQRLVARMRRIERAERLAGVARRSHLGQDVGRLREHLLVIDIGADVRIVHAAGLRVACVGQHRIDEAQLGLGERLGAFRCCLEIRRRIVAGLEPVGVGGFQPRDRGLGAVIGEPVRDPDRRVAAPRIEGLDRGTLFLAIEDAVVLRGEQGAQLLADGAIGGGPIPGADPGLAGSVGGSLASAAGGSVAGGGEAVAVEPAAGPSAGCAGAGATIAPTGTGSGSGTRLKSPKVGGGTSAASGSGTSASISLRSGSRSGDRKSTRLNSSH